MARDVRVHIYGSRAVHVTLKSVRFYCHELAAVVNYYLRPAAIYPRSSAPDRNLIIS